MSIIGSAELDCSAKKGKATFEVFYFTPCGYELNSRMKKNVSILIGIPLIGTLSMLMYYFGTTYVPCIPTFDDEFDGHTLDTSNWLTQFPSGGGGELQFYTPDAFRLWQGILSIYAEERTSHGYPYTSGIITTKKIFAQKYGYFVTRAKLPAGNGFWPGFWLLSADGHYPPEIDVFEMLGYDPYTIYMSSHWSDQQGNLQSKTTPFTSNSNYSTEFHTFAIDWGPSEIKWFIDGNLRYATNQGVPSESMYLLVNLAVGGDWPGYPDESTPFPGIMQIDYVRVYDAACESIVGSS